MFSVVQRCIAESLALDVGEIDPDSRLVDDLGADSLDFADIAAAIDHELGIQIGETEFSHLLREDSPGPVAPRERSLPLDAVEGLRPWLPGLGAEAARRSLTARQMFSLLTVEALCGIAQRCLEGRSS